MKRKRKNSEKDYNIKMKQLTLCSSCFHITLPTLSNEILLCYILHECYPSKVKHAKILFANECMVKIKMMCQRHFFITRERVKVETVGVTDGKFDGTKDGTIEFSMEVEMVT